jgi:hypothetical protein
MLAGEYTAEKAATAGDKTKNNMKIIILEKKSEKTTTFSVKNGEELFG